MPRVTVLALVVLGVVSGCGESNGLYPVTGQVLYKGEAAEGATVSFYRKDGQTSNNEIPQAKVEANGWFRLESGELGRGAQPGAYAVLVEWRQGPLRSHRLDAKRSTRSSAPREGKALLIADDRLKGRYFDIMHPRLAAEVKAEKNSLPPFELKD